MGWSSVVGRRSVIGRLSVGRSVGRSVSRLDERRISDFAKTSVIITHVAVGWECGGRIWENDSTGFSLTSHGVSLSP